MKFEDTFPQLHWFKYSEMSNFHPNVGYDLESSYYRATEILWNKLYKNVIMMEPPLVKGHINHSYASKLVLAVHITISWLLHYKYGLSYLKICL